MSGAETRHIFLFHWHLIELDSSRHDIDNLIFLSKKKAISHFNNIFVYKKNMILSLL